MENLNLTNIHETKMKPLKNLTQKHDEDGPGRIAGESLPDLTPGPNINPNETSDTNSSRTSLQTERGATSSVVITQDNTARKDENGEKWTTVRRRNKHNTDRTYRGFFEKTNDEPNFTKYFVISFPGVNIREEINILNTNKDLKSSLDNNMPKLTMAGYNSLLVEVINKNQSEKITQIKSLDGNPVVVSTHRLYNSIKGVVQTKSFDKSTIEELQEELSTQGVTYIRRINVRRDNELRPTHTYILTFNRHNLPSSVTFGGWLHLKVNPYKERPQQCNNCQKFGHVKKYCRRENPTCGKCGIVGHTFNNCTDENVHCINCEGRHFATSKECPKYREESEILAVMMKEKTSKIIAREKVLARTPVVGRSYSDAVSASNTRSAPENINKPEETSGENQDDNNNSITNRKEKNQEKTKSDKVKETSDNTNLSKQDRNFKTKNKEPGNVTNVTNVTNVIQNHQNHKNDDNPPNEREINKRRRRSLSSSRKSLVDYESEDERLSSTNNEGVRFKKPNTSTPYQRSPPNKKKAINERNASKSDQHNKIKVQISGTKGKYH